MKPTKPNQKKEREDNYMKPYESYKVNIASISTEKYAKELDWQNNTGSPTDIGLKPAAEEDVKRVIHERLEQSGFNEKYIEDFEKNGMPTYAIKDGKYVSITDEQHRFMEYLKSARLVTYAVLLDEKGETYTVLGGLEGLLQQEEEYRKNGYFLCFGNNDGFSVLPTEELSKRVPKEQFPEAVEKKAYPAVSASDLIEFQQNINRTYDGDRYAMRYYESENFVLKSHYYNVLDWGCYNPEDDFAMYSFPSINLYKITFNRDDYIQLTRDLCLVIKGSVSDIIERSGLTKAQFCDYLVIEDYMVDDEEFFTPEYRFLIGRFLGIIRNPSVIRDPYLYSVEACLCLIM